MFEKVHILVIAIILSGIGVMLITYAVQMFKYYFKTL